MPAWKKHEAGRRGRDDYDSYDYDEPSRREAAHSRIERLTRTATALGNDYDHPSQGGTGSDEDLNAVADELDRMLSARSDKSSRTGGRRPSKASRRVRPAEEAGLDDVMGALDRLDKQVQGLSGSDDLDEDYPADRRPRRAGRYAVDRLNPETYDDYETDDEHYDDDFEDRYRDDRHRRRQPHGMSQRQRRDRDASMHVYKDLGRRIDALRKPQEQALAHVREELGSLRDALGGLSKGTNQTVSRQNAELRRLADMVERLRADKKNDQLAKEIRKEVADLKTMVGRTNVEGALQTLEHGYAHILQRLDELSRASLDPRVLRGVTARLNEIEDAFAALPRSEHMMVLEDRVVSISERMEELLQHKGTADIEPLRAELKEVRGFVEQIDIKGLVEGIDDRMKFVSSRLDDLEVLAREQRGLDTRLSAMEERMPEPETINRLQGRLEDIVGMMSEDRSIPANQEHLSKVDRRLNDIVDRLERMEQAAPLPATDTGAFDALEKRLETISSKIDVIEKRAARPVPVLDAAAMRASNSGDNKFLTQLQTRLNDLTARLEEPKDTVTTNDLDKLRQEISAMRSQVAEPASTEALEQRIADLANVVSKGGSQSEDSRFDQLGAKVSALAAQIENTAGASGNTDQFASILERIETGFQQTKSDVEGIARKAVEDAVSNMPAGKNPQYDAAISDLQGDLKRLLDAAEGSEERTKNTFDGVKSVLGSITERLDTLERADKPGSEPAAPAQRQAGFTPIKVEERKPLFARLTQTEAQSGATEPATAGLTQPEPEAPRDRKADFIAAARRAAQAASAEAAQLEQNEPQSGENGADEQRGKARVGWLRNVLSRGKASDDDAAANKLDDAKVLDTDVSEDADFERFEKDDQVLPGDRPAPEAGKSAGGRRRAILYAAAAVVLLIGTYYITQNSGLLQSGGDNIATAPQENTDSAAQIAGADESTVESAAGVEAQQVAETSPPATPPDEAASAAAPVDASAASPEVAPAPEPATQATARSVQSASSETNAPDSSVAFAPPTGIEASFSDQPAAKAGAFAPSANVQAAVETVQSNLIANLPPEGVGPMALRSAAASGNAAAEFLVGVKYTEGSGVPADLSKAAVWYQKAADKGLAPAQYRLASLYEKGRGVDKDTAMAQAWYTKAADAGNAKAMHNLAVLFAEGSSGQPDYAAAAKWFEQAANFGVKDSLFNLGILYAGGIGVDKDLVASYKWFAIAADQGDPEAAKRRDDVANMMDQETLANARLAVENFKMQIPEPAANKVSLQPGWADASTPAATKAKVQAPDNTAMIKEAQDKLNYLGFDTGTPDGQMGPRTRSAIRAFQRSLGLPETGQVDRRLMDELKSQAI